MKCNQIFFFFRKVTKIAADVQNDSLYYVEKISRTITKYDLSGEKKEVLVEGVGKVTG